MQTNAISQVLWLEEAGLVLGGFARSQFQRTFMRGLLASGGRVIVCRLLAFVLTLNN